MAVSFSGVERYAEEGEYDAAVADSSYRLKKVHCARK
jgi:hypothetical protein